MSNMTIDTYKERLITDGLTSVKKNEKRQERIKGGVAGFELCRKLNSMADFEEELERRRKEELRLMNEYYGMKCERKEVLDEYWEYRYATVQIEYVFERMLVMWSQMGLYSGPLSARAVLRAADIVGVKS